MKKLFLVFSVAFSSFGFSQTTINYTNFNYTLLESMVVDEINTYRASLGLQKLSTSKVLRDSYSSVTANINAKQDKLFHTNINMEDTMLASKLYKEYIATNNTFRSVCPWTIVKMTQSGEIITTALNSFITYEEMSKAIIQIWLFSAGHKKVIETKFLNSQNRTGQLSCCIKKSESDTYYVVVGFVTLDVVPR